MNKRKIVIIGILVMSLFELSMINCLAKTETYNINVHKKIILKRGSKVRLIQPGGKKIKWKVSNKKIASITKKGILKAKKCGKITISAKVLKGKTYICKITVKKKVIKAFAKNIKTEVTKADNAIINFTIHNNSDECIMLAAPRLEFKNNGIWDTEGRKAEYSVPTIGVYPHIYVMPNSQYNGSYNLLHYDMAHTDYRIVFEEVCKGADFGEKLKRPINILYTK